MEFCGKKSILFSLEGENVGIIIKKLIEDKDFYTIFEVLYKKHEKDATFQERLNDFTLLIEIGKKYRTIGEFLNELNLNESVYNENKSNDIESPKLILSTIHKAKGLKRKR